jgi:hypothetical protein
MIALTLPTLGSHTPNTTIHLPFDPIIFGFSLPLALIVVLAHSWLRHERRRQSSMSLYDTKEQSSAHSRTLSELRSNPAAKEMVDSNQSAAAEQRKKVEDKEYANAFPDLTKVAESCTETERRRMAEDKELYRRMQNLEDYPGKFLLCSVSNHWLELTPSVLPSCRGDT